MYEQEIGDLCSSLLSQHSSRKGERREGLLLYIATRPHTHTLLITLRILTNVIYLYGQVK